MNKVKPNKTKISSYEFSYRLTSHLGIQFVIFFAFVTVALAAEIPAYTTPSYPSTPYEKKIYDYVSCWNTKLIKEICYPIPFY